MFRPPGPSSDCVIGSQIRLYIWGGFVGFGEGGDDISSYNSMCYYKYCTYYALLVSIVWVNYNSTVLAIQILKVVFDCITDTSDPINTTGMSHLKVIFWTDLPPKLPGPITKMKAISSSKKHWLVPDYTACHLVTRTS
jgi:hypothetical protein